MGTFQIKQVHKKRHSEGRGQRVIEETIRERQVEEKGGRSGKQTESTF